MKVRVQFISLLLISPGFCTLSHRHSRGMSGQSFWCPIYRSQPVWPSGKAGKRKGLGSIPLRFCLLFKKVRIYGLCLVTLSLTINKTLKWLSSLPILMQGSFWWWQCSDRYIISLFPHLRPTLVSLMVSVDVKRHERNVPFRNWEHWDTPSGTARFPPPARNCHFPKLQTRPQRHCGLVSLFGQAVRRLLPVVSSGRTSVRFHFGCLQKLWFYWHSVFRAAGLAPPAQFLVTVSCWV